MSTYDVLVMHCGQCRREQAFEQPACEDGHGVACPDWACLECGMAVFLGGPAPVPSAVPLRRTA